jgi:hypothetical protein
MSITQQKFQLFAAPISAPAGSSTVIGPALRSSDRPSRAHRDQDPSVGTPRSISQMRGALTHYKFLRPLAVGSK